VREREGKRREKGEGEGPAPKYFGLEPPLMYSTHRRMQPVILREGTAPFLPRDAMHPRY